MDLADMHICIVGGGIGGLAAALVLSARGARVTVLEQAEAIRELGAGIQLSPNGLRVIAALGLRDAVAGAACRGHAVSLRNGATGAEVARLDVGHSDYFFVHRADLVETLAQAARAAGVRIRLLQRVASVQPGDRPQVTLANGDTCGADLVIGADGLHSALRPVLNGDVPPQFTGQVAWRAVVPNAIGHPPEVRVHMGPGRHIVSYPLRDGQVVNLVAVEERGAWTEEGWYHTDSADAVMRAFAGFCAPVHRLLERVDRPGLWGLFRHPVARHWHGPGVALLGDAAHPTLPFLAQGANMALEDAWVLGDALARADARDAGLAQYQARRRPRAQRVIAAADGNAWKYHLRNPALRGAAHLGLRVVSRMAPSLLLRQYDWLYAHDVTAV